MQPNKIYSLELLRFFSSLAVVIGHYKFFFLPFNSNSYNMLSENYFMSLAESLKLGMHGVYIFFCISGVVFSITYLNKDFISFKDFFFKRFARLYPLHFATLILITLIQFLNFRYFNGYEIYYLNDVKHFFLNIFFISGWGFEEGFSFNGPIWSVSLEIIIYFIFFISIRFLNISKYVFPSIILVIAIIMKKNFLDTNLINCIILFFGGAILLRLFLDKKNILLMIISLLVPLSFLGNYKILLLCIGMCAFFLLLENILNLNEKIKFIFSFLGNLTYASYLVHIPFQLTIILIINYLNLNFFVFENNFIFLIFITSIYFISFLIFIYYEKPMMNYIKNKFLNKKKGQ